jgi:DNA repair protein RecN (Recombination protein N)
VRESHTALAAARRDIADLKRRRADAEKRADYLRHVVQEIEGAKLVEGEDVRLEDEARRLENAEELRELATGISTAIEGDEETVLVRLAGIERLLATIQRIDPTLARLQELYDNAYYALEALARELSEYESAVDLDPSRLEEVRRRRDLLFKLTKKYGSTLAEVDRAGHQGPSGARPRRLGGTRSPRARGDRAVGALPRSKNAHVRSAPLGRLQQSGWDVQSMKCCRTSA